MKNSLFMPAKSRLSRSGFEIYNDRLIIIYMFAWSLALLAAVPVAAAIYGEGTVLFSDFVRIITSPSKLVTDYFALGGLAATLLNAGLCGLACNIIMVISRIDPDARVLAGYFLVIAHCFYGLNFINMWPPFVGVFVYSVVMKRRFSEEVPLALFSTSLGPFISEFLFKYTIGDAYVFGSPSTTVGGIVLAFAFGILSGFAIPALLSGTARMHKGFSLYKAGLAIGLFGMVAYNFFYKNLGVKEPNVAEYYNPIYLEHEKSFHWFMLGFFLIVFIGSLIAGYLMNGRSFKGYRSLYYSTGYGVDFSESHGMPLCLVNFGLYGIAILVYVVVVIAVTEGVGFTGPTCGVIIAALTFAAAGQTIRNVAPIAAGYTLLFLLCGGIMLLAGKEMTWSLSTQAYINGLAFATGLCPFAGKYGAGVGIAAGFIDAVICSSTALIHGGLVLYNGGFAAGLAALVLVPILDFYNVKIKYEHEPPAPKHHYEA